MKFSILLFAVLSSFGAFAQHSNLAGYWTLASEDPLIVRADPVIEFPTYTATAVADPATGSLSVDFGDEIPTTRTTVAISDTVDNKLLKSTSFVPKKKEHIVSLESLKPGTYHVVVFRDDKRVLYMGDFRKQ